MAGPLRALSKGRIMEANYPPVGLYQGEDLTCSLRYERIAAFWLPLAASGLLMTSCGLVVNAGTLARR